MTLRYCTYRIDAIVLEIRLGVDVRTLEICSYLTVTLVVGLINYCIIHEFNVKIV